MPLFLVAMLTVPLAETIETTKSLELKSQVVEAFELGPVIIDVSVTNRGNKALFLEEHRWPESYLITPNSWHPWYRQSRLLCRGRYSDCGNASPGRNPHGAAFPFLRYSRPTFGYGRLAIVVASRGTSGPSRRGSTLCRAASEIRSLRHTGHGANRKALAKRLEAEFAALPPPTEKDGLQSRYRYDPARKQDPLGDLCEKSPMDHTPTLLISPATLRSLPPRPKVWR